MKNLFCELLPLNHKIKSLAAVHRCFSRLFGQIDLLFYLKTFLFFKIQKRHRAVSNNTQSNFPFKVLNAVQCEILSAISKKHCRYSLRVKTIIATEGTTLLFGLGQTAVKSFESCLFLLFLCTRFKAGNVILIVRFLKNAIRK